MNRRTIAIAVGVSVGLLAVWFLLLWSPKGKELTKARQTRAAAVSDASQLQVKLTRLRDAAGHEPELQASLDRLRSAVPDAPNLAKFILDTNDVATKAGVDFLTIAPKTPEASATGPANIGLAINVKGGYAQVLDFMNQLLRQQRVVVIDTIQVTPAPSDAGEELSVSLTGRMFTTEIPVGTVIAPTTAATGTPGGKVAAAVTPAAPATPATPTAGATR
jgi:Tfp pilus assembly protein PilO